MPPSRNPQIPKSPNPRRGLTLVELLVVVVIMMILVGFALPRIRPGTEQRRLREAANLVQVFLKRARAYAMETGRPWGVRFEPIDNPINDVTAASSTLYLVEVPPPYSGGSTDSRVTVDKSTGVLKVEESVAGLEDLSPSILSLGDQIQLNHQGPWYSITGPDVLDTAGNPTPDNNGDGIPDGDGIIDRPTTSDVPQTLELAANAAQLARVPDYSGPVPYVIQRRPTPSIAEPLKLPRGTVIDLSASGLNQLDAQFIPLGNKWKVNFSNIRDFCTGVTVMFSPNGAVQRCYYTDSYGSPQNPLPTEPLYFLIGREMQVLGNSFAANPDTDPDEKKANWQLLDNQWIVLSPQSGLVSVTENATTPLWNVVDEKDKGDCIDVGINEARKFAKQSQSVGGR